jgi:biotin synthase
VRVGTNVIMPNLTPAKYRQDYLLYENRPCVSEEAEACKGCLATRIRMAGDVIAYGEWGDSKLFEKRIESGIEAEPFHRQSHSIRREFYGNWSL